MEANNFPPSAINEKKMVMFALLALLVVFNAPAVKADSISADILVSSGAVDTPNNINETTWALAAIAADGGTAGTSIKMNAGDSLLPDKMKSLWGFDPGFAWDYALIKIGVAVNPFLFLYKDDGDNLLSVPDFGEEFRLAISHVTFFNVTTAVPEPGILILMGLGLLGIAGVRRKINK